VEERGKHALVLKAGDALLLGAERVGLRKPRIRGGGDVAWRAG
jgi:hypothetical protein